MSLVDGEIVELLSRHWGFVDAHVRRLDGGMNSQTWSVWYLGQLYVAKRVAPAEFNGLLNGCRVAAALDAAGMVTGPPVPTIDGRIAIGDPPLALLRFVAGRELDGRTDDEQRWIARTLARVHTLGEPTQEVGVSAFFPWLTASSPGVDTQPWLASAITAIRRVVDSLNVTWSLLHTDPAPEAFRRDDANDVIGLIDWTGAQRGPVLYDVASAVMYLGGSVTARPFIDSYVRDGPLSPAELQQLETFAKFRWAVQGAYFIGRLNSHDLTGVRSQRENERGLADARQGLASLGVSV